MKFSSDPINTIENLISINKTKSISIYLVIILAIIIFLILLPIIKVDISSQSRGMIRITTGIVHLSSLVNDKGAFPTQEQFKQYVKLIRWYDLPKKIEILKKITKSPTSKWFARAN